MSTSRLEQLRADIADHCVEIEELFNKPVKVTCIVRVPGNNEADVLITNDGLDDVTALIERSKTRPPMNGDAI